MKLNTWILVAGLAAVSTSASAFDKIWVFGDSLSDTGNVFAATGGANPAAPYWQGRYSNGPVYVEALGAYLNRPVKASLLGGTNFAYGGAQLNTGSALSSVGTPNIGTQIGQFQLGGNTFGANDLVVVWGGGNDFLNGATNPAQVAGYARTHLDTLYGLGARKFLVPNLPLLGYTPGYVGTAGEGLANLASVVFNQELKNQLDSFRAAKTGEAVYELDVALLGEIVRTNPANYGLTNVTQAYLSAGGNPDQFMFWDNVHPTKQVHSVLGQGAIAAVPEPATMLALAGGLAMVARRRRSK